MSAKIASGPLTKPSCTLNSYTLTLCNSVRINTSTNTRICIKTKDYKPIKMNTYRIE
jgi:hypothetical protein